MWDTIFFVSCVLFLHELVWKTPFYVVIIKKSHILALLTFPSILLSSSLFPFFPSLLPSCFLERASCMCPRIALNYLCRRHLWSLILLPILLKYWAFRLMPPYHSICFVQMFGQYWTTCKHTKAQKPWYSLQFYGINKIIKWTLKLQREYYTKTGIS